MDQEPTVNHPHAAGRHERPSYQNVALTAIAVMLGLLVVDRGGTPLLGPAAALAEGGQPEHTGGMVNAADQRRQMIAELGRLSQAVSRIESQLSGGLSVKVTDMPAPKPAPAERNAERGAGRGAEERPERAEAEK